MSRAAEPREAVRELRVEGPSLLLVGALLALALGGAFYLGRWYERRSAPATGTPADLALDSRGPVEERGPAEGGEPVTVFDRISEEHPAERARETSSRPQAGAESAAAGGVPAQGRFLVQVFAGRDRASAEGVVAGLRERGYGVRVSSERDGSGQLYKVRVGGYATREEAEQVAERLRGQGYPGSWVTPGD
jgi:cell division septation protein DedD